MTVSLFSLIVARGAEVPVVDPRLAAHVEYATGVDTQGQGPATQSDSTTDADALEAQPVDTSSSGSTDVVAPGSDE
jgi:hypothetical protein